ncbi:unnamed protein product [Merluccius merluccius]
MAILRNCLGVEGQRIFRTLGLPATYEETVALLTDHFTGQQRILLRRYKLRRWLQRPERGPTFMGLDLFTGLGFTLRDGVGSAIHHVNSTWQQKCPSLFDGVGCLTAFTHRPLVNPDVSPVIQPLRRIPLALRDDVTQQHYSVGERKALACVWASERWHLYLYGRHYVLRMDHQALTALLTASGSGHKPLRLQRWAGKPDLQCQPLCTQCHGHPAHGNTFSSTSVGRSTAVEFPTISTSWEGHYGHRHLGCTLNELLIWCLLASSQIQCSTMLWAHLRVTPQLFWEGHRQWSGRTGHDTAEKGSKLDVAAAASKRPVKQKSSVTDAATDHDSQQQSSN